MNYKDYFHNYKQTEISFITVPPPTNRSPKSREKKISSPTTYSPPLHAPLDMTAPQTQNGNIQKTKKSCPNTDPSSFHFNKYRKIF